MLCAVGGGRRPLSRRRGDEERAAWAGEEVKSRFSRTCQRAIRGPRGMELFIYATVDAVPLLLPQPGRGVRTQTRVTADTPQTQSMSGTDTCHCQLLTLRTLCYCGVTWPILTDTYFRATLKLKMSLIWYFSSSLNSYCGRAFCGALRVLHRRVGMVWMLTELSVLGDRGKGGTGPPGSGFSQPSPASCVVQAENMVCGLPLGWVVPTGEQQEK